MGVLLKCVVWVVYICVSDGKSSFVDRNITHEVRRFRLLPTVDRRFCRYVPYIDQGVLSCVGLLLLLLLLNGSELCWWFNLRCVGVLVT